MNLEGKNATYLSSDVQLSSDNFISAHWAIPLQLLQSTHLVSADAQQEAEEARDAGGRRFNFWSIAPLMDHHLDADIWLTFSHRSGAKMCHFWQTEFISFSPTTPLGWLIYGSCHLILCLLLEKEIRQCSLVCSYLCLTPAHVLPPPCPAVLQPLSKMYLLESQRTAGRRHTGPPRIHALLKDDSFFFSPHRLPGSREWRRLITLPKVNLPFEEGGCCLVFFFGVCVCACAKCMPAKFIYSVPWFFSLFRRFCLTTVLDFQQSNMWHPGGKKILFSTSSLTKTTTFGFATSTTCDILLNSTPAQPTLSLNSESNIKSFMHELTLKWHTAVQEELSSQESNYPWTLCSLGTLC